MPMTKAWDWSKNTSDYWLIPCVESCYLAERWRSLGLTRCLDLGCGLGRHSVYLAKHGFEVSAMDLSQEAVDHTRDWAAKEGLRVQTCTGNMLHLPFADDSFDCMIAYNVIYHTDTAGFQAALAEIRRILRPGGELFLTLISKDTWSYQHTDQSARIDSNTILRDEDATERNVPHFYVDLTDIKKLFADFAFARQPVEIAEYKLEQPEYCSKHWTLVVKNKK